MRVKVVAIGGSTRPRSSAQQLLAAAPASPPLENRVEELAPRVAGPAHAFAVARVEAAT